MIHTSAYASTSESSEAERLGLELPDPEIRGFDVRPEKIVAYGHCSDERYPGTVIILTNGDEIHLAHEFEDFSEEYTSWYDQHITHNKEDL